MFNAKDVHWTEFYELLAEVLGVFDDYTNGKIDDNDLDNLLYETFEISFEQFENVARCLMPMACSGRSPLTDKAYTGFVVPGTDEWIIKTELEEE